MNKPREITVTQLDILRPTNSIGAIFATFSLVFSFRKKLAVLKESAFSRGHCKIHCCTGHPEQQLLESSTFYQDCQGHITGGIVPFWLENKKGVKLMEKVSVFWFLIGIFVGLFTTCLAVGISDIDIKPVVQCLRLVITRLKQAKHHQD
jgi:hypothetical protein